MTRFSPKQADLLAVIYKLQSEKRGDVTIDKLEQELGLDRDYIAKIISGLPRREQIIKKEKSDRKTSYSLNQDNLVTSFTVANILIKLKNDTPFDYIKRQVFEENIVHMDFIKNRENNHSESDNDYVKRILDWCIKPEIGYIKTFANEPGFIGAGDRLFSEKAYLERIAGLKKFPSS